MHNRNYPFVIFAWKIVKLAYILRPSNPTLALAYCNFLLAYRTRSIEYIIRNLNINNFTLFLVTRLSMLDSFIFLIQWEACDQNAWYTWITLVPQISLHEMKFNANTALQYAKKIIQLQPVPDTNTFVHASITLTIFKKKK